MEAKTNYTIVGLVVVILIAALLSTALWLSVGFNQKKYNDYTVYLHEAASGLSEEAPVKYNGVQVGFVKSIKLNKNDPRQVELILSIEEGTPVTTSTFATLVSQGITGVTSVGLSASSSDLTPIQKMPGEPYPVIPAKPSLFTQLDSVLKEVAENVNKVAKQTGRVFNEENAIYIKKTLANMERISTVISQDRSNIDKSLKNADAFFANMAQVSKDFPRLTKKLETGITKFNTMAGSASETMVAGRRAIDRFAEEALPPAITLLRRLNNVSANIEEVSSQMRQNPSVLIRGTKPQKPGPGE